MSMIVDVVSMFHAWVMVLKLSKKVHFLQFYNNLSKKSKSVKAIYIYAPESSLYTFSEKVWGTGVWATAHEILAIKISKKVLTQQEFNKIYRPQTLISPKQ